MTLQRQYRFIDFLLSLSLVQAPALLTLAIPAYLPFQYSS
jgi:hypothetical protein